MATLGKAIALAADAFKDKTDKGGRPYMEHCLYVMEGGRYLGDEVMIGFLLHDWLEDIICRDAHSPDVFMAAIAKGCKMLREMGYTEKTIDIVETMTHRLGESYEDYIKRVARHPMAKVGKKRDMRHNMDITRLKGLRQKDFDRLEKYARWYIYLED